MNIIRNIETIAVLFFYRCMEPFPCIGKRNYNYIFLGNVERVPHEGRMSDEQSKPITRQVKTMIQYDHAERPKAMNREGE